MKSGKTRSVFSNDKENAELSVIDGEPIEFERNIFPLTSTEILRQIQKDLKHRQMNPEEFEGRILFMSMFNDIDWTKNGNCSECVIPRSWK